MTIDRELIQIVYIYTYAVSYNKMIMIKHAYLFVKITLQTYPVDTVLYGLRNMKRYVFTYLSRPIYTH